MREPNQDNVECPSDLLKALYIGDVREVERLIQTGANIHYKRPHGYDALIDAVHGRDISRDNRLIELLKLLIANGVELNGITSYQESALRVLSRVGRFDAIQLLLDAGADESLLDWTPLMKSVVLGSLIDVETALVRRSDLESRDWWSRTAWLIALLAGDISKAELLLKYGANPHVVGRCGCPPLFYAINGHHQDMLHWLLARGEDVNQIDDFNHAPLIVAAENDDLECMNILIQAGADLEHDAYGTALNKTQTREAARCLLDAGADPQHLSGKARRDLLGLSFESDEQLNRVSTEEFLRAFTRRFGRANPEQMNEPFWESMIRAGISAYGARERFDALSFDRDKPVWCAERFGQSITFLPDGRIVQIGGEHEDYYDPDFCIYNDVFVHSPDGSITIYGYPESVFPSTDFHTATLIGDYIYLIGALGYQGTRRYGETELFRLDTRTFQMKKLNSKGEAPGWIYKHRAKQIGPQEILIWGGKVASQKDGEEIHEPNLETFLLDLKALCWRRERFR